MTKQNKANKLEQVSRNYVAQAAKSKNNAGHMKHKNDRRSKDARKSWKNEAY